MSDEDTRPTIGLPMSNLTPEERQQREDYLRSLASDVPTLNLVELQELFSSGEGGELSQEDYLTLVGNFTGLAKYLAFSPHAELASEAFASVEEAFLLGLGLSYFSDGLTLRALWEKAEAGDTAFSDAMLEVLLENPSTPTTVLADLAPRISARASGKLEALINHPNADPTVWGLLVGRAELGKVWRDMAVSNLASSLGGKFYRPDRTESDIPS